MFTDYIWDDILRITGFRNIMSIPLFDFQHCYEILESTDEISDPVYLQEINRKANTKIFILALQSYTALQFYNKSSGQSETNIEKIHVKFIGLLSYPKHRHITSDSLQYT